MHTTATIRACSSTASTSTTNMKMDMMTLPCFLQHCVFVKQRPLQLLSGGCRQTTTTTITTVSRTTTRTVHSTTPTTSIPTPTSTSTSTSPTRLQTRRQYNVDGFILKGVHPLHLFRIIQDVDSYQDFLPYCRKSQVLSTNNNGRQFEALMEIGFNSDSSSSEEEKSSSSSSSSSWNWFKTNSPLISPTPMGAAMSVIPNFFQDLTRLSYISQVDVVVPTNGGNDDRHGNIRSSNNYDSASPLVITTKSIPGSIVNNYNYKHDDYDDYGSSNSMSSTSTSSKPSSSSSPSNGGSSSSPQNSNSPLLPLEVEEITSQWTLWKITNTTNTALLNSTTATTTFDSTVSDSTISYDTRVDFTVSMTISSGRGAGVGSGSSTTTSTTTTWLLNTFLDQLLRKVAKQQIDAFQQRCVDVDVPYNLIDIVEKTSKK